MGGSIEGVRGWVYLNPKDGWQGMASSGTKDLGSMKEPLFVAIELYHIEPISAVAVIEILPALP